MLDFMKVQLSSKLWVVGGIAVLLAAVGLVLWRVWPARTGDNGGNTASENQSKPKLEATISGQLVEPAVAGRRPVAVMVENHPDSRPQSGLSKAEVVYEMVAEGGITRYMALFQQDADSIGPVRSARDYYAELADSWGALYVHVGGSPEVLELLKQGTYKHITDVNEFYQADYFERIKTRLAPHNTYTSTSKLLEYQSLAPKDAAPDAVHPFTFAESATAATEPASTITINFSLPSYKALFTYDSATKKYLRTIAGKSDIDALTKEQLAPKTIIVQLTDIAPIPGDDKFRVNIRTTGTGKAHVFQNGSVTTGTWKREAGKPAQYLDASGNAIALNLGQIWIALVSKNDPVAIAWN